jgi:hypothetical protein
MIRLVEPPRSRLRASTLREGAVIVLGAAGGIAYNTMNDAVTAAPGLPGWIW